MLLVGVWRSCASGSFVVVNVVLKYYGERRARRRADAPISPPHSARHGDGDRRPPPLLHALLVAELSSPVAQVAVAAKLDDFRRGRERAFAVAPLLIVTGRGLRSEAGVAVLKPTITRMLAAPEYAPLQATGVPGNPGRLSISADSLRAWIAAPATTADEEEQLPVQAQQPPLAGDDGGAAGSGDRNSEAASGVGAE